MYSLEKTKSGDTLLFSQKNGSASAEFRSRRAPCSLILRVFVLISIDREYANCRD